jgi:hypothetical protein
VSDDPVIDTSRVDNYLRSRHRVEVLNSAWKPALAGAAGAMAIIGAVVVGVWIATPRFTVREVEVDHIVRHDVPFDNHIPQDKPFDNYIPRTVAPPPIAVNPPTPRSDAPRSPSEQKFTDTPEWKGAIYRGRIIRSVDAKVLSFAEGTNLRPAHWDAKTSQSVYDIDEAFDTDALIGLLAACVLDEHELWHCNAMQRDGQEITIQLKRKTANRPPPPKRERPLLIRLARTEFAEW